MPAALKSLSQIRRKLQTSSAVPDAEQKQPMREYIYWHNELFGVLLNDEEYAAMTVNDLKQAIENSDRTIVQKPDGEFDMIDLQANEYILAEYPEDTQPDELPE